MKNLEKQINKYRSLQYAINTACEEIGGASPEREVTLDENIDTLNKESDILVSEICKQHKMTYIEFVKAVGQQRARIERGSKKKVTAKFTEVTQEMLDERRNPNIEPII